MHYVHIWVELFLTEVKSLSTKTGKSLLHHFIKIAPLNFLHSENMLTQHVRETIRMFDRSRVQVG